MNVEELVKKLELLPHPEGGYYKEIYRSKQEFNIQNNEWPSSRSYSTAIFFLLTAGNFSAFHRIRSDEAWHFYQGAPLLVHEISKDGQYKCTKLGAGINNNEHFFHVVDAGNWFASETTGEYSLVGCTVAPGFDFNDFEMAERSQLSTDFPQHAEVVHRLTR